MDADGTSRRASLAATQPPTTCRRRALAIIAEKRRSSRCFLITRCSHGISKTAGASRVASQVEVQGKRGVRARAPRSHLLLFPDLSSHLPDFLGQSDGSRRVQTARTCTVAVSRVRNDYKRAQERRHDSEWRFATDESYWRGRCVALALVVTSS